MPIKFCTKCETNSEVTKKGYNAKGQQRWLCKNCGKTFVVENSPIVRKTKDKKKVKTSKTKKDKTIKVTSAKKKEESKTNFKTIIKVNSIEVKKIDGDVSTDEAFDMVSDYFREIAKKDYRIQKGENQKIIIFSVKTGTKGAFSIF